MDPEETSWLGENSQQPEPEEPKPPINQQQYQGFCTKPAYDDPIFNRYGIHRPDDYREVTGTEPPNFGGW